VANRKDVALETIAAYVIDSYKRQLVAKIRASAQHWKDTTNEPDNHDCLVRYQCVLDMAEYIEGKVATDDRILHDL
jgi:hypothetical protein